MNRTEYEETKKNAERSNVIEMYLLRKYVFAALFILLLFCYSGMNIFVNGETVLDAVVKNVKYYDRKDRGGQNEILYWIGLGSKIVSECEDAVNDNLILSKELLWLNGRYAKAEGKREMKDFKYYKDLEGYLQYGSFFKDDRTDVFEFATRVRRLKDAVSGTGAEVMYVITPSKYTPGVTKIYDGVPINNPNPIADELIMDLNRLDIETLDLRNVGLFDRIRYEDSFFKTDHHWTIPAALDCAKIFNNTVKERFGIDLDPDGIYTDPGNYRVEVIDGVMFGSMGRGSGLGFTDSEPFTMLWPEYDCHFDRRSIRNASGYEEHKYGDIAESLLHADVFLNRDIYTNSYYELYLNGLNYYDHIENLDYPDRPKVLFIRDSYFSPVMTFLAAGCGSIDAVWTLEDSDLIDIEEITMRDTYDLIIIEVYPYSINDESFNYFR